MARCGSCPRHRTYAEAFVATHYVRENLHRGSVGFFGAVSRASLEMQAPRLLSSVGKRCIKPRPLFQHLKLDSHQDTRFPGEVGAVFPSLRGLRTSSCAAGMLRYCVWCCIIIFRCNSWMRFLRFCIAVIRSHRSIIFLYILGIFPLLHGPT